MNTHASSTKLPALAAAGSFFILLILGLFTNPTKNISYVVLFLLALLVFISSVSQLMLGLQKEVVSLGSRIRILVISLFMVLVVMIRSAQSLTWVDGLILALIALGVLFYSSRRSL